MSRLINGEVLHLRDGGRTQFSSNCALGEAFKANLLRILRSAWKETNSLGSSSSTVWFRTESSLPPPDPGGLALNPTHGKPSGSLSLPGSWTCARPGTGGPRWGAGAWASALHPPLSLRAPPGSPSETGGWWKHSLKVTELSRPHLTEE